jgi:hypothetical protein
VIRIAITTAAYEAICAALRSGPWATRPRHPSAAKSSYGWTQLPDDSTNR